MEVLLLIFKKYSLTVALIGAGISLIMLLIIYLISLTTGKGLDIAIGPIKFNTKKKTNDLENIKSFVNLWSEGKQDTLIDSIIDMTEEKTEEIDKIKFIDGIARQMVVAEDANIRIKSLIMKLYSKLMKEKLPKGESVKQHKEYRYYQAMLSSILEELKRNTIKQSLKCVDIVSLSDIELDLFINQKSEIMLTIIIEYIDFMQNTNSVVSVDELHDKNFALGDDIKKIMKDMYISIKNIIMEDKETVKKIDDKFQKEIQSIKSLFSQESFVTKIKKRFELLEEKGKQK